MDGHAAAALVGHQRVGDGAFVERLGSVGGDEPERSRKIGLDEKRSSGEPVTAGTEEILALEPCDGAVALLAAPAARVGDKSFFSQPNRRRHHLR